MLERYLIRHCSPTLASLKTANLFNMSFSSQEDFHHQLHSWDMCLRQKGIYLQVLLVRTNSALVYVYRRSRLENELSRADVAVFLADYGYQSTDVDYAIERLKSRLQESCEFPHEIGVFLGYPLGL